MDNIAKKKTIEQIFERCAYNIVNSNPDAHIMGIAYSSEQVQPGDAFFCIVGDNSDGHSFAQQAVDAGASVIVCQRALYLANSENVPLVVVNDTRKAMSVAAAAFYGYPSEKMNVLGVTGTNGKTTTTYLVQHVLAECGRKCGIIGTTGVKVGNDILETSRTTPESADLQKMLRKMIDVGCDSCVMEVSSHALALDRVWGMDFEATAFTNLTQDHLDYHKTFDEYFEAKAKLFSSDYPAYRVINKGNDYGFALYERCMEENDDITTYSFFEESDIYPQSVKYESDKTIVQMRINGISYTVEYPLVGRFNLENVMCAIGMCLSLGVGVKDIIEALKTNINVPGRLEHVIVDADVERKKEKQIPEVYVDYAHTPDAVSNAASAVGALKDDIMKSKNIIVIGCGGDRDKTKRPLMGQAALKRSDYAIITSDNPRTENPNDIIDDIVGGLRNSCYKGRYEVIADRREAIRKAIQKAGYGDVVLLAGKGHENYQIVGDEKRHFDDREEARADLEEKLNT